MVISLYLLWYSISTAFYAYKPVLFLVPRLPYPWGLGAFTTTVFIVWLRGRLGWNPGLAATSWKPIVRINLITLIPNLLYSTRGRAHCPAQIHVLLAGPTHVLVHSYDRQVHGSSGQSNGLFFSVTSHTELVDLVSFSIWCPTFCWALSKRSSACLPSLWVALLVPNLLICTAFGPFTSPKLNPEIGESLPCRLRAIPCGMLLGGRLPAYGLTSAGR